MDCRACGAANDDESRFCEACGAALERECSACEGKSKASARFCRHCGQAFGDAPPAESASAPVAASATPAPERSPLDYTPPHLAQKILQSKHVLEGEHKLVTVLFADVKGSMELAAALGPEAWHAVLDGFFAILNAGVHQYEGTVNQYTGDGIMALFGAPIAHEDHAQRACYAALQMCETLRAFSQGVKRQHGVDFAVRIGINSGEVVVGKIGDDLRMDYTAQGSTVGLAQRMESLASSGSIYLAEGTARLVEGYFDLDDLGAFNVKGSSEPVQVQELLGEGALRTRFDVSRERGLSRFVGRNNEMKILEDAVDQAIRGNGQVVGLVADAGTGKSRLTFEFVERCRARGLRVNVGRCVAHGKTLPFLPVLELIRSYYGITPQDDDRTAREKVAGRMLLIDEDYRDVLPVIFEFIGIPDPERPAPPLPPEARQRQLFGVLRSITKAGGATGQEATVVVVEDLHWIDGGSEPWISQWVDAAAGSRTMVLLNFRPEYHAPWMQRAHYQQIALAPLSAEAIRELLETLIGTDESTRDLAARIHRHTAGNPFFAEEAVRSLIESGQLEGSPGAYRLTRAVDKLTVPANVQAVLGARIDRLPERHKNVLQVASVIGKTFLEPVVAAAAKIAEEDLAKAFAALRAAEFLHEVSLYPVAEYSFKHPLTQQVALESLLTARRRALHVAVAEVLEARSHNLDEDAALLATHWDGAGDAMRAAPWHLRAADWIGANDVHEVESHARAVIDGLRERADEDGASQLLARAATRLVNLGWRLGIDEQAGEALYRDGCRWARAAGDVRLEAQLAGGQGAVRILAGDVLGCIECADEFERLAQASGDSELQMVEHGWMAYPRMITGRLADAMARIERAMAAAERNPELGVSFLGASLRGVMYGWKISIQFRVGRVQDAEASYEQAIRWVRARGEVENEHFAMAEFADSLACYAGDGKRAIALARQALRLAEELASPISLNETDRVMAAALLVDGDAMGSLEALRRWRQHAQDARLDMQYMPRALAVESKAHAALGQHDEALRKALEAVGAAQQMHTGMLLPDALLALAEAQLGRGEPDEAEVAIARLAVAARDIGARNFEPHLGVLRAELCSQRDDLAGRDALLAEALQQFTDYGARGHAEKLAARLGGELDEGAFRASVPARDHGPSS